MSAGQTAHDRARMLAELNWPSDNRYPVIVEYTHRHVIWVEAPSQADAVSQAETEPYEMTDDQKTLVDIAWSVAAPRDWDWHEVYEGGYHSAYLGLHCDAHVRMYRFEQERLKREATRAECAAAGHPEREAPLSDGRQWCVRCGTYLPADASRDGGA